MIGITAGTVGGSSGWAMAHCAIHTLDISGHPDLRERLEDCYAGIAEEDREWGLRQLRERGVELRRGDLVTFIPREKAYRNEGLTIFDGTRIIELADEIDEYGYLPQQFRVIEDGTPIDYWHFGTMDDSYHGIDHNAFVWFDHRPYRQEMIANLRVQRFNSMIPDGIVEGENATLQDNVASMIVTTFTVAGTAYRLVVEPDAEMTLNQVVQLLNSERPVIFSSMGEWYDDDPYEPLYRGRTLYITVPQ